MRKCILFLLIISSIVFAQFEPGTISAGALFGYNSYGDSEDEDRDRQDIMSIGGSQFQFLLLKPTVSYFISRNISIDGIMNIMRFKYGDSDPSTSKDVGGGISMYFKQNLYVGGSFTLQASKSGSDTYSFSSSAQFIGIQGGLLHKVAENVYLDVGINYLMGIGDTKFEYEYDGGTDKNEKKILPMLTG